LAVLHKLSTINPQKEKERFDFAQVYANGFYIFATPENQKNKSPLLATSQQPISLLWNVYI